MSAESAWMRLHPAVRAFMASQRMDEQDLDPGGRLTLFFDESWRVHVHSGTHDRVVLTSPLLSLAGLEEALTDELLWRLLRRAARMVRVHPSTLCIEARSQKLLLQQCLSAHEDVRGMEDALAEFVNLLPYWRFCCTRELRSLSAGREPSAPMMWT